MARAVISDPKRRAAFEPIYDADPQTGASIEVFFADHGSPSPSALTRAGSGGPVSAGCLPEGPPTGPFANSYRAYRGCCYSLDGEIFASTGRWGVFGRSSPLIRSVNADTVRTPRLQNCAVGT